MQETGQLPIVSANESANERKEKETRLEQRKIREEGDDVLGDGNDHSCLVDVPSRHDLDVISRLEVLPHTPGRNLDPLVLQLPVRRSDGDRLSRDRVDRSQQSRLLSLEHLDDISRLKNDDGSLPRGLGNHREILLLSSSSETSDFLERRVDVLGGDSVDLEVLLDESVLGVGLSLEDVLLSSRNDRSASVGSGDFLVGEELGSGSTCESDRRGCDDSLLPLLAVEVLLLGREVDSRDEPESDFLSVFGDVDDLSEISGVLSSLDSNPRSRDDLDDLLLELEEGRHLLDWDQVYSSTDVDSDETLDGSFDVGDRASFNVDETGEGVSLEGGEDLERGVGVFEVDGFSHDAEDDVSFSTSLEKVEMDEGDTGDELQSPRVRKGRRRETSSHLDSNLPEVGIVYTRHQEPLGDLILISLEPRSLTSTMPLPELLSDPFSVSVVELPSATVEELMIHSDSTGIRSRFLEVGVVIDEVGSCNQRSKKGVSIKKEEGTRREGRWRGREGKLKLTLFDVVVLILVQIFVLVVYLSLDINESVSLLLLSLLQNQRAEEKARESARANAGPSLPWVRWDLPSCSLSNP